MPSSVGEERQIEALLHHTPHKGEGYCCVCVPQLQSDRPVLLIH